jgi:LysR family transcriptional regulator, regulator for genes of the gallate degradation pathway
MDLRLLRYFAACVEMKTMHAAADAVNVSQPALSKAIQNLETELGVKLLDRCPRGVIPTPYGETLFRYAKMMDSEMRRALAEIDAMRGMTRGTIVLGVLPTMCATLTEVFAAVMERHSGLRLKLKVGFSSELTSALLEGEIDLAVTLLPAEIAPLGLAFEPLIPTGPVVVVRKEHPLAKLKQPSLKQLTEYPWLIPDYPSTHRAIINRAFIDAGVAPPAATIDASTVIFFGPLIRQTDIITVAPVTLLGTFERSYDLVALRTNFQFPAEQIGITYRQNNTLLPGAHIVIDLIRVKFADFEPAQHLAEGAQR